MVNSKKPAASIQPERTLQEPYRAGVDHRIYEAADLEHVEDISDDSECKDPTTKQPYQQERRGSSFIGQFSKYLRNPETRMYTIINAVLAIIAILLLALLIVFLVFIIVNFVRMFSLKNHENRRTRCFYEWEPWGECSEPCRVIGKNSYPNRSRRVNMSSVVAAADGYTQCPSQEELKNLTDYAPCNTHYCPVTLSSLPWDVEKCFAANKSLCFMPRKGLDDNILVELDVADVFKECPCKPEIVEFAK